VARTLGKRWPTKHLNGDYLDYCGYCGAAYPRSKLVKDGSGVLRCPQEGPGLSRLELDQKNTMLAQKCPIPRRYD